MACPNCGAKRGHMKGCPTAAGERTDRARAKGRSKGIMKPGKPRICYACKGSGMVGKKACPFCHGTGEKN